MNLIEISRRNYVLLVETRSQPPRGFNEQIDFGERAADYDQMHRFSEVGQQEYPARMLIRAGRNASGYGRALKLGAGSDDFTTLIARRASS